MKLYTKAFDPGWDRIVDMVVERTDSLSDDIKDKSIYKVILHEKGEISLSKKDETVNVKNPAMIVLSDSDVTKYEIVKKGKNSVLYFKPSVVRDEFILEDVKNLKFAESFGTTIYQDYMLIKDFNRTGKLEDRIFYLSLNELNKVKGFIDSIEKELTMQYDGFWPCRSRSYLMEFLFFIQHKYFEKEDETSYVSEVDEIYSSVCNFLNEHLGDNITLESITKEFSINRNKLNAIFVDKTSKTCLNYLLDLRMDMAKIMLANTEIPIGEISMRVGFMDANYFTKAFKKYTGKTPTEYRKSEN